MERKSWKLWILVVLAVVMVCAIGMAEAEGSGRLKTKMPIPVRKRGADFTGDSSAVTCEEKSWTITRDGFIEDGYYYEYTMGISDGSYPGGDYTDSMYTAKRVGAAAFSPTFTYTFYEPGVYWLYAEKYTSMNAIDPVDLLYQYIRVTEGNHANPLTAAVTQAAAACLKDNDFATVEAINDYICDRVEYDDTFVHHSPESALLDGTGVCSSYSRAFKLIADACGLQCRRVTGTVAQGGHAWNLVKMDGQWYQMDLTWNDTSGERHLYFGLTDALISNDHFEPYIVGGDTIVCNSMADNWFIHTGEWDTRLARSTKTGIQTSINSGATQIEQNLDIIYVDSTSNRYYSKYEKFFLYGNILAYGYSQKVWDGPNGTMLRGPFAYDYNSSKLTATLTAVNDMLSIGNIQNKTTFETGEAFSFLARFITSNATGVTLKAEITKEGETEATDTKTTDTNQGEFGFRIWDEGEYNLVISAFRNGELLASEQIDISVEVTHGYLNVDATIPQYWPVPPVGSLYRLTLDYENADIVPDMMDVRVYPYYGEGLIGEWIGITPGTVIEFPIASHNLYSVEYTQYKQGYRKTTRNTSRCKAVIGQLNTPTLTLPTGTIYAGEPVTVTINGVENADYYKLKISGPQYDDEWSGSATKHVNQAGDYLLEQYGLDGGTYTITLTAEAEYDYEPGVSAEYTLTVNGERHPAPTVNEPAGTFTVDDTAWFTITGEGMTAAARNGYNDTTYQAQNGTAMIPIEVYRYTYASFRGMFNGRWSEATDGYSITGNPKEEPERPAGPALTFNPTAPKQGENLWVGVTPVDSELAVQYAVSFGQRITYTDGEYEENYMDQIFYDMPFDISEGGVLIEGCNLFEPGEYMVTVTVYSDLYGGCLCETTQEVTVGVNPHPQEAPTVELLTEENLLFGTSLFEISDLSGADRIYAFISIADVPGVEENPREIAIDPSQTTYTMEWTGPRPGTYVAYFAVSRNGVWSDTSAPLEFEVTTKKEELIEAGELYYPEEIAIGEPLNISWDAVNGVEWYEAEAYTGSDDLYDGRIEKGVTSLTIDTGAAEHSGSLWVSVRPYVPGYYHNDLYTKEDIRLLDPLLKITATVTRAEDTANIVHLHLTNVQANRILVKIDGILTGMYGLGPNNGTADLTIAVPSRTSQIQVANYDTDPRKWGTWSDPVTANDITLDPTKTLCLPEDLTEIEANAFEGIAAEAVIIPDGCTKIGAGAFKDCPKLKYVSYKQGTTMGEGAFDGCAADLVLDPR